MVTNMAYIEHAPTHLGAGIHKPSMSANRRSIEASFLCPSFMTGFSEGLRPAAPHAGIVNSVKPVTLLLHNNGGSSLNQYEDTTMSNNDLHEIQLCRLTLPEMIAFKAYLKNLVMLDEQGIKHIRMNTPDLISACKKAIKEIEFMQGLGGEE